MTTFWDVPNKKIGEQPVTVADCLMIESLPHALRSATFVVPASLCVQEGGLIALCAVFSLPATIALALSDEAERGNGGRRQRVPHRQRHR
jgi:hypothetical protein